MGVGASHRPKKETHFMDNRFALKTRDGGQSTNCCGCMVELHAHDVVQSYWHVNVDSSMSYTPTKDAFLKISQKHLKNKCFERTPQNFRIV